jgi:hypothetical protein
VPTINPADAYPTPNLIVCFANVTHMVRWWQMVANEAWNEMVSLFQEFEFLFTELKANEAATIVPKKLYH